MYANLFLSYIMLIVIKMWLIFVIIYIILYVIFTQTYKLATHNCKNDGALTVLLQIIGGFTTLLLSLFFKYTFPSDIKIYILLIIACVFYAISDRLNTTVRKGIEASTFGIINQLSSVFMIGAGFLFFKEKFIVTKLIGAVLIILSNILMFYKKGSTKFNKYILLGILANLSFSIALFLDVNISSQFNLALYVSITLMTPIIFISLLEKIKIKDIKNAYKNGNNIAIISTGIVWGLMIFFQLNAYKYGNVTTVAPLCALTVIGNVIIGYIFMKERDNLIKKFIAAVLIVISVILINI